MIKIEDSHKLTPMKRNSVSKRFLLISIQSFVLLLMTMNIFAGTVHTVGGSVTYTGGGFPISATISAYITSRSGEVLSGTYYPGTGQYDVQCGNFPTSWTAGDILHVDIDDGAGGIGSGEVVLTNNSNDVLNIVIVPPSPPAPIVGTITQPTCTMATGSVDLSGLPASGTWTLTR